MKAFKIPDLFEVEEFIRYRQSSWPEDFVTYYAEKFWSFYQARGWRLSSNVAMKDWQAAFNSQWKNLKYDEDIKKLEECRKKPIPAKNNLVNSDRTVEYLDDLLSQFKSGSYRWEDLATPYKYLFESSLMRFTPEEREKLVADAGNNKEYGRYLAVKMFFGKLLAQNLTFSEYIKKRA